MITRRKFFRLTVGAVASAAAIPVLAKGGAFKAIPYQETSLRVMGTETGRWSAKIARHARMYSYGLQNFRRMGATAWEQSLSQIERDALVDMDYTEIEERVLAYASAR